ncbi:unnamed protein product [Withania somnifera]
MASYVPWRLIVVIIASVLIQKPVFSEPQTYLLGKGCSQYNATNLPDFLRRLDASFDDLRNQLLFMLLIECRKYLSRADCVSCYDAAVSLIRTCSGSNGARVTYDGCFLRYESNNFYQDTTLPGNAEICGNRTASQPNVLSPVALQLLNDLSIATLRISDFFAATKREVSGVTVYGVARCAETTTESGCNDCLAVAYKNIEGSLPKYTEGRAVDAGCFYEFIMVAVLYAGTSNKKKAAIIGGVVGGVGLHLIILAVFLWYQLSRKPKAAERVERPVSYRFKDLKYATKDFNESNKLSEGGFDVYKGTLKNGNVVKKLAMVSSSEKADFEIEVRLISEKRGMLNWKQRFNIIFGTARGLTYLHEQFHVCIIHRDIKSNNILLDDEFQPKIADSGLIRLLPDYQSHVSTKFAGTLGYTAPEYAIHGHLTEKVDVYSFGVVVLEIISGRSSNDMQIEPVTEYLLEHAWKLHESGTSVQLVDETLDPNEYNEQKVKKVIEIALMCTQSPANLRPSMSEVVVMILSERSTDKTTPTRPTIISMDKKTPLDSSMTTGSSASNATNTFSDLSGR